MGGKDSKLAVSQQHHIRTKKGVTYIDDNKSKDVDYPAQMYPHINVETMNSHTIVLYVSTRSFPSEDELQEFIHLVENRYQVNMVNPTLLILQKKSDALLTDPSSIIH